MNIINYLVDYSTEFISSGGPLFGFFIVFLECFIPALPLSVFVALNVNAFGFFIGVTISWIATFIGSYLCYLLFYFLEEKNVRKLLRQKTIKKIQNSIDRFKKKTISISIYNYFTIYSIIFYKYLKWFK